MTPAEYEAWYHTPRGSWVSHTEFELIQQLLQAGVGQSLLDVGCGTGHFSRRLAVSGLRVTGIDPDSESIAFARAQGHEIDYMLGSAMSLPFDDATFDSVVAITSLCFIDNPLQALTEMWRVCRTSLLLGLLNRHSLLYQQKHGRGAYRGARWDTVTSIQTDLAQLVPQPRTTVIHSAIFTSGNNPLQRQLERLVPQRLPWGAFLAVSLKK